MSWVPDGDSCHAMIKVALFNDEKDIRMNSKRIHFSPMVENTAWFKDTYCIFVRDKNMVKTEAFQKRLSNRHSK